MILGSRPARAQPRIASKSNFYPKSLAGVKILQSNPPILVKLHICHRPTITKVIVTIILMLSEKFTEGVMHVIYVIYVILTLSEKFGRGGNACNICNIDIE